MGTTHPLTAAKFYHACGYSVIPILPNGTKKPAIAWDAFKTSQPSAQDIARWFTDGKNGIALIQGAVSGLRPGIVAELLEFETREVFDRFLRGMEHRGHQGILAYGFPTVQSPGGGIHLHSRHSDEAQGNQKLARGLAKVAGHNGDTLIETRGEGGYVLAPGSPARCHQSGRTYELLSGSFKRAPVLSPEERQTIFSVCRELDERPVPTPKPRQGGGFVGVSSPADGTRPGDDFNERGALDALACLERHGWSVDRDHGEWQELCRPGKTRGGSATFGYVAPGVLHVFSSNALPFELDSTCGPFEILARLDFGGDFGACARFLGNRGYGTPFPVKSLTSLHCRPAHSAIPGEVADLPLPGVASPALTTEEDLRVRYAFRRLCALMRLSELGMVSWPTPADVEGRCPDLLPSVLGELQLCPLSDTLTRLESEMGTGSGEAALMLLEIDYLFDCVDYYTHRDCVDYYTQQTWKGAANQPAQEAGR